MLNKIDSIIYLIVSSVLSITVPKILVNYKLDNSLPIYDKNTNEIKNKTPILGGIIFIIPVIIFLLVNKSYKILLFLLPSILLGLIDDINKITQKNRLNGLNKVSKIIFLIVNYILFFLFKSNLD